jgi:molybdopterin synthase sulfurtransferase
VSLALADPVLVSPSWLAAALASDAPPLVLDVGWRRRDEHAAGHVPTASYVDTDDLEAPPFWKCVARASIIDALLRLGVHADAQVVVHGAPTMAAARVAWLLRSLGVADVRLLDGGLAAWRAAGHEVERGLRAPVPRARFGGRARPELIATRDDVRRALADADALVVCTRSLREHRGEVSGYPDLAARGRIAGSVWGHGGSDKDHLEDFEREDGRLRDPAHVSALWAARGITGDRRVVFYCGTGWRASVAALHAWRLGWPRVSVYDGGWYEWSADPSLPTEAG